VPLPVPLPVAAAAFALVLVVVVELEPPQAASPRQISKMRPRTAAPFAVRAGARLAVWI
jgi:hypothetical protein